MKTTFNYTKLKQHVGVYKHRVTGRYLAIKRVNGKKTDKTFDSVREAIKWRQTFNGKTSSLAGKEVFNRFATLSEVWKTMQECHFPLLADSTQAIWQRRYELLAELGHLSMDQITSSVVSSWVQSHVAYFKSANYEKNARGYAKRCNLNNELNLLKTIFNWYKQSEQYEHEAVNLVCPVKPVHKKKGFIRPLQVKNRAISLDHAFVFFSKLPATYQDLAMLQFFTASRISEAAGLQWHRIDFDNRQIVIMETSSWDQVHKTFVKLNKMPKNKEPRKVHMTDELYKILKRRQLERIPGNDFVFHFHGRPLNYGTILLNYREAQKKSRVPYTGTHILRHGMATLARKVGGGLDAVIAMTGHKDFKLADHYSKLDNDYQKEVSEKIMQAIRQKQQSTQDHDNIAPLLKIASNAT